jgi:hypothetical protein
LQFFHERGGNRNNRVYRAKTPFLNLVINPTFPTSVRSPVHRRYTRDTETPGDRTVDYVGPFSVRVEDIGAPLLEDRGNRVSLCAIVPHSHFHGQHIYFVCSKRVNVRVVSDACRKHRHDTDSFT